MVKKDVDFRSSSLEERERFYKEEFSISKIKKWFSSSGMRLPQLCAIDAGSETDIILNKKWKNQLFYFHFNELNKKIKKYIPEDIYYCRNFYDNPREVLNRMNLKDWKEQELVFDIDLDNLSSGILNNKNIQKAFQWTFKMRRELQKDFEKVVIVYSGRGFHIHVFDKKVFFLSRNQRKIVVKKFSKFPIDPWVSMGNIDLIRMPYSLHGLVSRVVVPLKDMKFDEEKTYPRFMVD